MSKKYLTRAAAVAMVLAAPVLAATARADDEYGTGHETVIRYAAMGGILGATAQNTPDLRFVPGHHDNFGAPRNDALIRQSAISPLNKAPVEVAQATNAMGYRAGDGSFRPSAPLVGGRADLIGAGGHQDELARAIYRPGSGTDF